MTLCDFELCNLWNLAIMTNATFLTIYTREIWPSLDVFPSASNQIVFGGKGEGDSALSLALQDLKASTGEGTATIPDDFPSEGEVSLREIVE